MSTKQKIAILNSRQGLYPCRLHNWIQQTVKALNSIQLSQPIILSSIGMSTWEILTIAASELQLQIEIYIQIREKQTEQEVIADTISEYNLNSKLVSFVSIFEDSDKEFQKKRDMSIISSANTIYPISVRSNGNLEKLFIENKIEVNNSYNTAYEKRKGKIAYTLDSSMLSKEIQNISDDYIIHWTKTSKDKWHHERQSDYYSDVLHSDNYPRKAIDTLNNILKLKTIYATPTHMPQNIPTVSFTSLTPQQMIPLFKWRSRYQEMSFEPYGIGIKKNIAVSKKIQEVLYYEKSDSHNVLNSNSDVWLTQSKGMYTNWESENEFRHLGDFHFAEINKNDIILFTRYKKEADQLYKLTGFQSISFLL